MHTKPFNKRFAASIVFFIATSSGAWPGSSVAQTNEQRDIELRQSQPIRQWPNPRKRFALIIGVKDYQDAQISSLDGTVNDARDLEQALITYAGFAKENVTTLISDRSTSQQVDLLPTKWNILEQLSNILNKAQARGKDSLVLVAFGGHGTVLNLERKHEAFLLPMDGFINRLETTGVRLSDIKEEIEQSGIEQVMVIVDACRSDLVNSRTTKDNILTQDYRVGLDFQRRNNGIKAFATLYATGLNQRAYEYYDGGRKRGYFTSVFVEGISGAAANQQGEITLGGLISYLERVVPSRVQQGRNKERVQVPFSDVEGYRASELLVSTRNTDANSINGASPPLFEPKAAEMLFWDTIKYSNNPEDYRAYLDKYPEGQFIALARIRANTLSSAVSVSPSRPVPSRRAPPGIYVVNGVRMDANYWAQKEVFYRTQLQRDSRKGEYHYGLANALNFQRKDDEAEASYREAIRLKPKESQYSWSLGRLLEEEERFGEAEMVYRAIYQVKHKDADANHMIGEFILRRKRYAQAEPYLRKAVELDHKTSSYVLDLIRCLERQNKGVDAEQFYGLLRPSIGTAGVPFQRGLDLEKDGFLTDAEMEYRIALRINPTSATYRLALAENLKKQNRSNEARAEVSSAIAHTAGNAEDLDALGRFHLNSKQFTDAETTYRRAISIAPKWPSLHENLGIALYGQNRFAEAETEYRIAFDLSPQATLLGSNLLLLLEWQGRTADIQKLYEEGIQKRPDDLNNYTGLASLFLNHNRPKEAETVCRTAISRSPRYGYFYALLGEALTKQRMLTEAETAYRQAIALDPNEGWRHNSLAFFLNHLQRHDEAEAEQLRAIELEPNDSGLNYNMAVLLVVNGKYAEAEAYTKRAIALKARQAYHYSLLGSILEHQRKFGEALEAYKQGRLLNPEDKSWEYNVQRLNQLLRK